MSPNARLGDRSRQAHYALVSVAGLILAVLAESCSVGLVGLSGWFIASSAVAGAGCATLAFFAARRIDDGSQTRSALRTELVTAVGAWPEMASLGAADQLASRTLRRLATFEGHRFDHAVVTARTLGAARAV